MCFPASSNAFIFQVKSPVNLGHEKMIKGPNADHSLTDRLRKLERNQELTKLKKTAYKRTHILTDDNKLKL